MRIAIISSSTFPSTKFDSDRVAYYGSEWSNCYLCESLAEIGHQIEWYAPIGSEPFKDNPNINYHPIRNSYGEHLADERLESVCFEHGSQTTDLMNCDFVMDMSKQGHCIEELYYYNKLRRFLCYRSGHRDHLFPARLPPLDRHYVLPNKSFVRLFANDGFPADYVQHFIPDFWSPSSEPDMQYWKFFEDKGVKWKDYFLFGHRASLHKGLDLMVRLVKALPKTNFVFSTSTMLKEHLENWNMAVNKLTDYPNAKFIQCPMMNKYHFYRRELMRGAKAMMSPYAGEPYHDMAGYVGLEAASCGTPIILSDTIESREIWTDEADRKSLIYVDSFHSAKMAIENFDSYNLKGQVAPEWTKADTINKYTELMKKYS